MYYTQNDIHREYIPESYINSHYCMYGSVIEVFCTKEAGHNFFNRFFGNVHSTFSPFWINLRNSLLGGELFLILLTFYFYGFNTQKFLRRFR